MIYWECYYQYIYQYIISFADDNMPRDFAFPFTKNKLERGKKKSAALFSSMKDEHNLRES